MKYRMTQDPRSGSIGREIKDEIRKSIDLYLAPSRAIVRAFGEAVHVRDSDGRVVRRSVQKTPGKYGPSPSKPK